ncbi:alpha/beta fold hydrolase [Lacrimispora sp.]|uniref:alpha/beta fold hydrolase n=1 Tax=Lacrimispora sp. TaxID=2719234 RepID=UPI0028B0B4D1|nr:alpha/beta hydrolase [Lacrimispora sp.]
MYIDVNGVTLYYEVSGSGPAIVLVHGNAQDHRIFLETAQKLNQDYTVYLLDSRCHGKSSRVKKLGYEEMAKDVAEFAKKLDLKDPYFCGYSDGGIIGLLLGIRYPGLFKKLILCGANSHPQGMKRLWLKLFALTEKFTFDHRRSMIQTEPRITAKELGRISAPTMILAGQWDMVKEAHTRYLASNIRHSILRILPREGHGSYIVHSEKLYYIIKKFLAAPMRQ